MDLSKRFEQPPAEFRQAPFWFWNDDLDPQLLIAQIDEMHDKGLGGFVMHARHGLVTPYLSNAWFDCIRLCCGRARELGMLAWAYDERDWPSGPAGGEMLQDPANRLSFLRMDRGRTEPAPGEEGVAVYAGGERLHNPVDAERHGSEVSQAVRFECPPIFWFESYLDTLNPEACRRFIGSTYDLHEQELGNLAELGLAGFFTDEPALNVYPDDLRRIPWTPELPVRFREMKGYDLLDYLPALFHSGAEGAQVRHDYWDVATTLFEQAFVAAIAQWCEKRGLRLIGHPLGEEPLFYQFRCLGTAFKYLRHPHMPGMDHLTITVGKNDPLSMAPKLVASAALLAGRERTMTETFGESGWGLTLADMKWMADWQMVHGINYFVPHAFYYSIGRRRKRDSPPSEFFQMPHWPYYGRFADYTARVTAAMTGGEHVAKIALFYPMSSVWADFVPGDDVPGSVRRVEAAFAPLGETLLSIHRDFVIIDEENLAGAEAEDGAFTVAGLRFEALVLPPMTSITREALDSVRRIADTATVLAVEDAPLRVLNESAASRVRPSQITGVRCVGASDASALAATLASVSPDVHMDNAPDVYYLHRRKEGKDLFFFANTGEDAVHTTVSLECAGAAESWDPATGNRAPVPGQMEKDDRLSMPLSLPQRGSQLIVADPSEPPPAYDETPFTPETRIPVCDGLWHFTPFDGNFALLNNWRVRTQMRHKVMELRYSTEFNLSEPIANLRLILDGIPARPYGVPQASLPMLADETQSEVLLDGEPLTRELAWEIDPAFHVLDMGHAEPGRHRLEIVVRNHGWFPQPGIEECIWIAGDFMLDSSEAAPRMAPVRGVACGPWEEQGFPYFSGTGAYAADIGLPVDLAGKRVFLRAGNVGSILEVEVNGKDAGVCPWPPYEADITACVVPGRSNLVVLKVTNTLRNLFEGPDEARPSGLLEEVYIEIG